MLKFHAIMKPYFTGFLKAAMKQLHKDTCEVISLCLTTILQKVSIDKCYNRPGPCSLCILTYVLSLGCQECAGL